MGQSILSQLLTQRSKMTASRLSSKSMYVVESERVARSVTPLRDLLSLKPRICMACVSGLFLIKNWHCSNITGSLCQKRRFLVSFRCTVFPCAVHVRDKNVLREFRTLLTCVGVEARVSVVPFSSFSAKMFAGHDQSLAKGNGDFVP